MTGWKRDRVAKHDPLRAESLHSLGQGSSKGSIGQTVGNHLEDDIRGAELAGVH